MCLDGPDEGNEVPPQLPHNGLALWRVSTQACGGASVASYKLKCRPSEDLPAAFIRLVKFFLKRKSSTELYEPIHQSVECNIKNNQAALLTTWVSPFKMYIPLSKSTSSTKLFWVGVRMRTTRGLVAQALPV